MMDWGNHMTTAGWIFSILGMLIIFALFVVTILWIVSQLGARGGERTSSAISAREILDRRLASGEITADQYDQLRAKLAAGSAPSGDPSEEHAVLIPGDQYDQLRAKLVAESAPSGDPSEEQAVSPADAPG